MYRISIKKNNVKRVSENPVVIKQLPTKWEVWQEVEEPAAFDYELSRMLEKCEILAYKVEAM